MAVIEVKLRFVGVYFNAPVTFDTAKYGTPTVKNVMDEYISQKGAASNLSYAVKEDTVWNANTQTLETFSSLLSVTHDYSGKFDANGDGKIDPKEGATLGGVLRPKGIYQLTEFPLPGAAQGVVTWQYYVQDQFGKLKSNPKATATITRFDKSPPDYTLQDKDVIIWRMVAIALAPTYMGKQPRATAPVVPANKEMPETYTTT